MTAVPLAIAAWLFIRGLRHVPRPLAPSRAALTASIVGWTSIVVAVVSPLDALGEALASAHMVQHLVLTLVAAPLLAFGRPWNLLPWATGRTSRKWLGRRRRLWRSIASTAANRWMAGASYILVLSIWHGRTVYEAALASPLVHGLEHATFLAAGMLFWASVARDAGSRRAPDGSTVLVLFLVAMHGVFLSALMTFAGRGWYPSYASTSQLWGLGWVEDQNLAGVIMWTWGSLVYVSAGVSAMARWVDSTADGVEPDSAYAQST